MTLNILFAIALIYGLWSTVRMSRNMGNSGAAIAFVLFMVISGMFLILGTLWPLVLYQAWKDEF